MAEVVAGAEVSDMIVARSLRNVSWSELGLEGRPHLAAACVGATAAGAYAIEWSPAAHPESSELIVYRNYMQIFRVASNSEVDALDRLGEMIERAIEWGEPREEGRRTMAGVRHLLRRSLRLGEDSVKLRYLRAPRVISGRRGVDHEFEALAELSLEVHHA